MSCDGYGVGGAIGYLSGGSIDRCFSVGNVKAGNMDTPAGYGAAGGFVQGLVILWILCIVLTVFSSSETAKEIFAQINKDSVLSYIYNHNLLLQMISDVVKLLG